MTLTPDALCREHAEQLLFRILDAMRAYDVVRAAGRRPTRAKARWLRLEARYTRCWEVLWRLQRIKASGVPETCGVGGTVLSGVREERT